MSSIQKGQPVGFMDEEGHEQWGNLLEVMPVPVSGDYPLVRIEWAGEEYQRPTDEVSYHMAVTIHLTVDGCEDAAGAASDIAQVVKDLRYYRVDDWEYSTEDDF